MTTPKQAPSQRWKEVLAIAWPLIIANSFWNLQLTIDRVFLGQYSTDSLGAAMAVMGVFWVPMALLQQTAAYSTTFTAQYLGAKQEKNVGPAVWQSIYLSLLGGLAMMTLYPMSRSMFELFGHSSNMIQLETEYFQALLFSGLPTAVVAAISGFYTGVNRTQMVMWINGTGLIANVLLDYLLIFGNAGFPELGISGAGYATAGANVVAAIFAAVVIYRSRDKEKYGFLKGWAWNPNLAKRFLRFGIPNGLQFALEGMAFTVFLILIGRFDNGDVALSASSITVTILLLAILPPMGVAQAVSARVGQFLGDNRPDRAENYVWTGIQINLSIIFVVGASFLLLPEFYTSWFANDSDPLKWQSVQGLVPTLLGFCAVFAMFDAVNLQLSFALRGAGDTQFVSAVALIVPWPVMVLPTWLSAKWANALYWSWGFCVLYVAVLTGIYYIRFRQGKWRSMRVIETAEA